MKPLWRGSRTDGGRKPSTCAARRSDRSPSLRSLHVLHAALSPQPSEKRKVSLRQTLTCVCLSLNFGLFPWRRALNPASIHSERSSLYTCSLSPLCFISFRQVDTPPAASLSGAGTGTQEAKNGGGYYRCNEVIKRSFCASVVVVVGFLGGAGAAWHQLFVAFLQETHMEKVPKSQCSSSPPTNV